jgi:hypothetical protein
MYSENANAAQPIELYSVWNPPTSSASHSAMSKGSRLFSASAQVYVEQEADQARRHQQPGVAAARRGSSRSRDWCAHDLLQVERCRELIITTIRIDSPSVSS